MKNTESKLSTIENFGDKRLKKRAKKVCSDLTIDIKSPITTASKNQSSIKGAYRFFSNEKVSQEKIIQAHLETLNLGSEKSDTPRRILQISDTTELDYTNKRSSDNLGVLNYPRRKGFQLHSDVLVSNLGVPLGIFKQTYLRRELEYLGKSAERRKLPLIEKESYRWYDHFKAGEKICEKMPDTEWVYIADRDIEQPIYWVLLTTLDIDTDEQLEQIIGYYIWRWLELVGKLYFG